MLINWVCYLIEWRQGCVNGDAASIGELAKFIDIDKGTISRVVDK
jgi:hypothetical protein